MPLRQLQIPAVRQIEVNIDYILFLIEKYKTSNKQDKEIIADIESHRTKGRKVEL